MGREISRTGPRRLRVRLVETAGMGRGDRAGAEGGGRGGGGEAADDVERYGEVWGDEIWGDMGRYGEIRGDMGRYGESAGGEAADDGERVRGGVVEEEVPAGRYGEMRGDVGRCGEKRGEEGRRGEIWGGVGRVRI